MLIFAVIPQLFILYEQVTLVMRKFLSTFYVLSSFTCFGQYHISGRAFYDNNYDHAFNNSDVILANKHLKIKQLGGPLLYYVQTDATGVFDQEVQEANYQVFFNDTYDTDR